jgi:hypothetical protein
MIVDEVTQTPKKRKRKSSSRSRRPHSSRSSSESSSTTGSKVKLSQFTPVSARLANASHYGMRVAISVGAQGSFPENDKELTLKVIGDAVSAEPSLLDKFEAVQHDPVGLETLLKYVSVPLSFMKLISWLMTIFYRLGAQLPRSGGS